MTCICRYPHCYLEAIQRNGKQTFYCRFHLCEHGDCTRPIADTPLTTTSRYMGAAFLCEFHIGWMIGNTIHAWKLDEWQAEQERLRYREDEQ